MQEISVMTSCTSDHTDCRGGGGEAGQILGTGVFGQFSLAGNRVAAKKSSREAEGGEEEKISMNNYIASSKSNIANKSIFY